MPKKLNAEVELVFEENILTRAGVVISCSQTFYSLRHHELTTFIPT